MFHNATHWFVIESGVKVELEKITSSVLYGESDGVWVHLQRENRRSAEARVAIMSTGRKQIGKDRYRLEYKLYVTAIGMNSEMWQEQIVREAIITYGLRQTKLLISGGDGNQWVRHSLDRMEFHQEFVLDRFHLHRSARRAFQDRTEALQMVTRLCQEDFANVDKDFRKLIELAEGPRKE